MDRREGLNVGKVEERAVQAAKVMGMVKGDRVEIAGVAFEVVLVRKKTGDVKVRRV